MNVNKMALVDGWLVVAARAARTYHGTTRSHGHDAKRDAAQRFLEAHDPVYEDARLWAQSQRIEPGKTSF